MAQSVEFGLAKGGRLGVLAPTELMLAAAVKTNSEIPKKRDISFKSLFVTEQAAKNGCVYRVINGRRITGMHPDSQLASHRKINVFFRNLIQLDDLKEELDDDARFKLLDYRSMKEGRFEMRALIKKPELPAAQINKVVATHISNLTRYILGMETAAPIELGRKDVLQDDGRTLSLSVDNNSRLQTSVSSWYSGSPSSVFRGHEIHGSAQPIVYLAAAVAVANADRLAA